MKKHGVTVLAILLIGQLHAQKMEQLPTLPSGYSVERGYKPEPGQPELVRKGFQIKKDNQTKAWIVCGFTAPASRSEVDSYTEPCDNYSLAYISETRDGNFEQAGYDWAQSLQDITATFIRNQTYADFSEEQRQELIKPLADAIWVAETAQQPAVSYQRAKNWEVDASTDLNPFSNNLPTASNLTTLLIFDNKRAGSIFALSVFENTPGYKSLSDAESAYAGYWRAISPALQATGTKKYGAYEFKRWIAYSEERHSMDGFYLAVVGNKLVSLRTFSNFVDIEAVNTAAEKFLQWIKVH